MLQALANHMTYEGQLECGNEQVSNQKISMPPPCQGDEWAKVICDEAKPVIFFDTSSCSDMCEAAVDNGVINRGEASIVLSIIQLVKTQFVQSEDHPMPTIGVMSPYRAQASTRDPQNTCTFDPSICIR